MKMAVYCGASVGNNASYVEAAKSLGRWIASSGHTLVYGGGKAGLMGIVADEVLLHNGEVIGVIPTFLVERELSHPNLNTLEIVHSMSERKKPNDRISGLLYRATRRAWHTRGNIRGNFLGKNWTTRKSMRAL